jgi:hypothetical protein
VSKNAGADRPPNPRLVLLFALAAPGAGHFLLGRYSRALGLALFSLLFAALTWKFCPPDRSIIGHTAGGLFIWALSVPDAYRTALVRQVLWSRRSPIGNQAASLTS